MRIWRNQMQLDRKYHFMDCASTTSLNIKSIKHEWDVPPMSMPRCVMARSRCRHLIQQLRSTTTTTRIPLAISNVNLSNDIN